MLLERISSPQALFDSSTSSTTTSFALETNKKFTKSIKPNYNNN